VFGHKRVITNPLIIKNVAKVIPIYIYICISVGFLILNKLISTCKVFKCGAGQGWRRSVGPIV
jgi:hypothetical protein